MLTLKHYNKEKQIKDFIYDKLQRGWTVKKLNNCRYEFKKNTELFECCERIHSDNFLTRFLKQK
jgi:hypothetical protein